MPRYKQWVVLWSEPGLFRIDGDYDDRDAARARADALNENLRARGDDSGNSFADAMHISRLEQTDIGPDVLRTGYLRVSR